MEYKYQSIILGKHDIGETDRMYVLYTREAGKLRLAANGVRKPQAKLAGNLETLSFCEIFLAKGRGRGRITGAVPVEMFLSAKGDIERMEKIFWALGVFDRLVTQEEKDEKVFDLLLGYLRSMDALEEDSLGSADIFTLGFIFQLISLSGYALEMERCVACGQKLASGENFFDAARGGVVCPRCAERSERHVKITDESIKFIRVFANNKIENLVKLKAEKDKLNNLKLIASEAIRWITS